MRAEVGKRSVGRKGKGRRDRGRKKVEYERRGVYGGDKGTHKIKESLKEGVSRGREGCMSLVRSERSLSASQSVLHSSFLFSPLTSFT